MRNEDSISRLKTDNGAQIAYRKLEPLASTDQGGEVVFLGGFASDMSGAKATALEAFCDNRGYGFVRFDYRGHGASDGEFLDFGIGDWIEDAKWILEKLTSGPVTLIGSSMGGWIALNIARDWPDKVNALITIAAAPDFSEDSFWASFSEDEKNTIENGQPVERESGYEEPYWISPQLIHQGREHLVMRQPLELPMPVRLLQGMSDTSVSNETALNLAEHITASDLELRLIKNADHSFSKPENLEIVFELIDQFMNQK